MCNYNLRRMSYLISFMLKKWKDTQERKYWRKCWRSTTIVKTSAYKHCNRNDPFRFCPVFLYYLRGSNCCIANFSIFDYILSVNITGTNESGQCIYGFKYNTSIHVNTAVCTEKKKTAICSKWKGSNTSNVYVYHL